MLTATATGTGILAAGVNGVSTAGDAATQPKTAVQTAKDISPPEDLMREHVVLNRILLIYDECLHRIHGKKNLD